MATTTNQIRSGSNDDIRPVVSNNAQIDDKADIEMNEFNKEIADDVIMKSPFEDLSWKRTWVVFKKAALMCLFASFSAAAE
jgi:SP family general alpha glucoside:H+ symporter-like MFS transporter